MRTNCRQAFSLIEVLIVVVIMAVLAATIIPQFSSSANDARQSSITFTLHAMRMQLQHYRNDHNSFPVVTASSIPQLLNPTDRAGNINATRGPAYPYGPYILDGIPENPFTGKNTVAIPATNPPTATDLDAAEGGWLYDPATGEVWAGHALP